MKQNDLSMKCAGSLTPELEGAQRTSAHPRRGDSKPAADKQHRKGGTKA